MTKKVFGVVGEKLRYFFGILGILLYGWKRSSERVCQSICVIMTIFALPSAGVALWQHSGVPFIIGAGLGFLFSAIVFFGYIVTRYR